jgi:hypothetical protein
MSSGALTPPASKTYLFPSNAGDYRFVVTTNEFPPPWIGPTISRFASVQELAEGWDSYGGKKINHALIRLALSLLAQIMDETSSPPAVVPLSDGGLQLEWHRKQQDLEISFPADDRPQFSYQNRATGIESGGFASDVMKLAELVRNIA